MPRVPNQRRELVFLYSTALESIHGFIYESAQTIGPGEQLRIVDLNENSGSLVAEVAQILVDGFQGISWPDLPSALKEVRESFAEDRISRVAVGADGHALGWVGGIKAYDGHVWEMHPLVVKPTDQLRGIGAALVADFEECVVARGGKTVMLGADDETNKTSLAGVDLYPDVTEHIRNIRNLGGHQYEFYQKQGYTIVGVIPDANGFGKPDILMAKRICA